MPFSDVSGAGVHGPRRRPFRFLCLTLPGLTLLALTLLAGGCGQIPQPFRPVQKDAAHSRVPGPSSALVVEPLAGPDPDSLLVFTDLTVERLRRLEIAATLTDIPNRYRLSGEIAVTAAADPDDIVLTLTWTLWTPNGESSGQRLHRSQMSAADWRTARVPALTLLATDAAEEIRRLVLGDLPSAQPAAVNPPYRLAGVRGAPGDGNDALARAMTRELAARDIVIGTDDGQGTAFLEAHVAVTPADKAQDAITILWLIRDRTGRERGRLEQRNRVPAGRLTYRWGDVAIAAAAGAAPDLARALQRLAEIEGAGTGG